jgi:hypothetical protein
VTQFVRFPVGEIGGIHYVPSGCLRWNLMHANFESGELRVLRIDPTTGLPVGGALTPVDVRFASGLDNVDGGPLGLEFDPLSNDLFVSTFEGNPLNAIIQIAGFNNPTCSIGATTTTTSTTTSTTRPTTTSTTSSTTTTTRAPTTTTTTSSTTTTTRAPTTTTTTTTTSSTTTTTRAPTTTTTTTTSSTTTTTRAPTTTTTTTTSSTTTTTLSALLGDCQADGDFDLFDVLFKIDVFLGRATPTATQRVRCDDDCDGDIDLFDILREIDLLLGRIPPPLTCP